MNAEPPKDTGQTEEPERPRGLPSRAQTLGWVIPVDFLLGAFVGYHLGKRAGAPMTGLVLGMLVGGGLAAFEVWKMAKYTSNDR